MKKRRISKINSFAVIMLIISFLVGFCGVGALFDSKKEYETTEKVSTIVDDSNIIPDIPQKDDDKDEVQPVNETTEFVKKSYEEYFTDNNISSDIADTTITGTGIKEDPYVLNSGADVWYFNKYLDKKNKYFELGCDIYLNDESFDEQGNPSGGDGIIYNWVTTYGTTVYFNGKGHTIYGFYLNYPEESNASHYKGFFHSAHHVSNLSFDNFYVCSGGNYLGVIASISASSNTYFYNCHIKKGVIKNTQNYSYRVAGIVSSTSGTIENCTSSATFVLSNNAQESAGIAGRTGSTTRIINCKNYSNINGRKYVGGIVGEATGTEIINCENYGKITVQYQNDYAGGIVGETKSSCIVRDCSNYGQVEKGAGIAGYPGNGLLIQNCKNFGYVRSGICSWYGYDANATSAEVIIDNCYNYNKDVLNYFGFGYKMTIKNCHIETCQNLIEIEDAYRLSQFNFINSKIKINKESATQVFSNAKNINIRNCEITTHSNVLIDTSRVSNVKLNNVIWNSNNEVAKTCRIVSNEANLSAFEKNSVIVHNYDESSKTYDNRFYGSNFKDFYISWKTGKIGLTQLDGTGAFQDIVNVTKLKSLGYTWEDDLQDSTYTKLEYIESTGTQYIDSRVNFSLNLKIETKYELTKTTDTRNYVFGLVEKNNSRVQWSHSPESFAGFNTTYEKFTMTCETGKEYNLHMDSGKFILDGTVVSDQSGQAAGVVSSETIRICAAHIDGEITHFSNLKLYSFNIAEGNNLIRQFIPAKRNTDGVVGLYDQVEGKFYTNQGTGNFVAGPKASNVPAGYQELEYIESTGTQYIDTGVIPTNETKVAVTYVMTNGQQAIYPSIFGAQNQDNGLNSISLTAYGQTGESYVRARTAKDTTLMSDVLYKTNQEYEVEVSLNKLLVNGKEYESSGQEWDQFNYSIYIFTRNTPGIKEQCMSSYKLYSFKIYNGTETVRSFIPAKRNTDGMVGLYDIVEGKFYTNQGSENFVAGAAK